MSFSGFNSMGDTNDENMQRNFQKSRTVENEKGKLSATMRKSSDFKHLATYLHSDFNLKSIDESTSRFN